MRGHYVDTVWHYAPDSKNVPPKGNGATVLNPMSKNIARDHLGLLWVLLGSIWVHCGSFCTLWVPLGDLLGSFGILWGCFRDPLGLPREAFWGPLGGTLVLLGFLWGPRGDQVGNK